MASHDQWSAVPGIGCRAFLAGDGPGGALAFVGNERQAFLQRVVEVGAVLRRIKHRSQDVVRGLRRGCQRRVK